VALLSDDFLVVPVVLEKSPRDSEILIRTRHKNEPYQTCRER